MEEKLKLAKQRGNFQDIILFCDEILKKGKIRAGIYFDKGNAQFELNQFAEAMESFSKALELDCDNIAYLLKKGCVARESRNYDIAMECFDRVIELEPRNDMAIYNKALTYKLMGDFEITEIYLDKAISINPKNKGAKKEKELLNNFYS